MKLTEILSSTIYNDNASTGLELSNCTFSGNSANSGGALYVFESDLSVTSTVW